MPTEINALIRSQKNFFAGGQTKPYEFRKQALDLLYRQLQAREDALLSALRADLGESAADAQRGEWAPCMEELRYCRHHLRRWMLPRWRPAGLHDFPSHAIARRDPYGVVLILATWSMPLRLTLIPLCDALAAGNCVLLKPSELTPNVNRLLSELCQDIFPAQYVSVLEGGAELGAALSAGPVDFIFCTGNALTGQEIMGRAAERLTPLSLQLGGKSPCLVSNTCDLSFAAEQIVNGKMRNSGQDCLAPDYILVQKQAKEAFLEALCVRIREMFGVDPLGDPNYQPIISAAHFDRVRALLSDGRIVWGGRCDPNTLKIEPTVLDNINWSDAVMRQEIFGPVFPILVYDQMVSLVQRLNRMPHPLTAYLFSASKREQALVDEHLICGSVQINAARLPDAVPALPYGGVGQSGFGAYRGEAGFRLFTRPHVRYKGLSRQIKANAAHFDEELNSKRQNWDAGETEDELPRSEP